jgi:acyl carrier protein
MESRKELKKEIKDIIEEECCLYKVKASDFLDDDLDLEDYDFKKIRDALNCQYDLDLRKRDIKDCIDVNEIIDLVYNLKKSKDNSISYKSVSNINNTSDDLNIFEKGLVVFANGIIQTNDAIKEKWDIDIMRKMGERAQKEEEWAEKHPLGNIAKQLGKGTLKGVGGELIGGLAGEIVDKIRKK